MRQAGEPSVEEILESIKKVIARDNRTEAAQQRQRRENEGVVTTQTITQPAVSERPRVHEVLELTEAETAPMDEEQTPEHADEPALVAPEAVASMRDSLAALAVLAEPGVAPQIVRSGETSLEGLTRELLRPMLAEWLDKNLPAMVEKMVAAEIAKISGRKN
jgi:cell pole-organizing protein PopZ